MSNHILLQKVKLTQSASSITFSNIPQSGYTDLKIAISIRNDRGSQGPGYLRMQFNGVTTGYSRRILWTSTDDGNSVSQAGSDDYISFGVNTGFSTANTFCNGEIYIINAFSSNAKSASADVVSETNSAFNAAIRSLTAFNSTNTNAISSISLLNDGTNFLANSTFSLYGVATTGITPTSAPKADGGNIISTDGTYWYHTFLSSGFFTPISSLTCNYYVLGGGATGSGGGSSGSGGGGGGGGSSYVTSSTLSAQPYVVNIGAGGPAGGAGGTAGRVGNDSTFNSTTGGGGQQQSSFSVASPGGTGTTQNGGNGGIGYPSGNAQNGGAGYTNPLDSVARGGGGGGSTKSGTQGTGTDGGGNGVATGTGGSATANKGGGGGGSAQDNTGYGGAGGSGIVIIRYAV